MNIRLFKPSLGQEELENIKDAFDRGWIGLGPKVAEFEQKWAEFIGCKVAIGLNSATAALHLALRCFGFTEGKKVLVPSLTFAATATAILYNRLVPVFVDSDPVTLGMSLEDLERKYDKDCVAVIPVHYCGHPVPMDKLMPWARTKGLEGHRGLRPYSRWRVLGKNSRHLGRYRLLQLRREEVPNHWRRRHDLLR